jgi:O-antigen ligase
MIRSTLLWMFIAFLAAYSWRDWYKSLCGLILLMAVVEHPDFPKTLMGVQGMNPWNILLFIIVLAWAASRGREGLKWDMPGKVHKLLIIYFSIIVIAFIRMLGNLDTLADSAAVVGLEPPSLLTHFSEQIVNCFKWVIPGLLLYDGCRSEQRFRLGVYCIVAVYFLLAIQVIRWMPLSTLASGSDLEERSVKILLNEIGYHRVNMAMLLAGGSWAMFCTRILPESKLLFNAAVLFAIIIFFGVGLSGGRMGFATWGVIALVFGIFKWKKVMILAPVCLALIVTCVPAVKERMLKGFTEDTIDTNVQIEELAYAADEEGPHMYTVTAGRTFAWGFVVEKILQAPLLGYGREAMKTTGLSLLLWTEYGESFPHPHNAYLEWIFDNGVIGLIPVFMFYLFIVRMSVRLFRDETNKYGVTIGGITLSLVLALLIAAIGSQTFYPREGAVGMWCAIGLALRVYVQKQYVERERRRTGSDAVVKQFWGLKDDRKPYQQYRHA